MVGWNETVVVLHLDGTFVESLDSPFCSKLSLLAANSDSGSLVLMVSLENMILGEVFLWMV